MRKHWPDELPFAIEDYRLRLTDCQQHLRERGLFGALIFDPENIYWLVGYQTIGYFTFQALFIPQRGEPVLITRVVNQDLALALPTIGSVVAIYGTDDHIHILNDYLTMITPENGLGPDMADAWPASSDATTWTFELNKNASFHSGKPFTSKDAIASLNFHRGEGTTSAAASLLADVKDIKADGDHTVVIELNQGIADLPWFMTDYHLVMLPANDDGTIDWESGDGAGPYKLDNYEPGVGAELTRHDGWHGEGAWFDGVKVTLLNDANARQSALITGDVDTVSSLDLKTMALMSRNQDIEIDDIRLYRALDNTQCKRYHGSCKTIRSSGRLSIFKREYY